MAAGDNFAVTIQGRFERDLARWLGIITDRVKQAWGDGTDREIVREELRTINDDIQFRMDMAADSAAWQGYQTGRIDAIDESGDLFDWELDPAANHCGTCPVFASNSPYTFDELPGVPGDAPTECNGGCRCSLTAHKGGKT